MNYSSTYLYSILIICVSVEAAVITWDNILPWSHSRNVYNVNYKDDECVNFNLTRTRDGKSIDTKNACITLYAEEDCQGESTNFKSNKTFFPFLDRVNFEGKAVSFKKCDDVDRKLLETRDRPRYHLTLHASSSYDKNSSSVLSLQSGECITMPSEWQSRIPQRYNIYETTLQIFVDEDCMEIEKWGYPLPQRTANEYERDVEIGSVRVLGSNTSIGCTSCPRFLRVGGQEYIFWTYLFSKYGNGYMETFQARVNHSTDGFISWDFLFTADASTLPSIPDVDALQSHIILFESSRPSELSQLGLTQEYLQTLGHLAYDVHLERLEDMKKNSWTDWYNFYIGLWIQMYTSLLSSPKLEFVGRSNYSLEFYAEGAIRSLTIKNDGECKSLPAELRDGRVEKVLQGTHCFVLFEKDDCTGSKHWTIPHASFGSNKIRQRSTRNDQATRSLSICGLTFEESCTTCPQLFYTGSMEYNFWVSFLNIYSNESLPKFKQRVKSPMNGFISWEFLEGSNKTNRSLSDQYRFALDTLFSVIRSLLTGRDGELGFSTSNVENLRTLAANVLAERQGQGASMDEQWAVDDIVTMSQLHSIWFSVKSMLNQTLTNWNLKTKFDDRGFKRTAVSPEINAKIDLHESGQTDICGIVGTNKPTHLQRTTPLISGGILAKNGDDPWHAALYRRIHKSHDPVYICGATLISRTVLVTAAHCFYDEALGKARNNTSEYEIILGKFTSEYSAPPDSTSQSKHKVKELVFYSQGYDPVRTDTYGADIILIILQEPVKIDMRILPVCLDWNQSIFTSPALNGATGRLVGWGQLSNETYSSYLMTADLPYISFNECKGKVSHLPTDKFCAGSEKGPGARMGDSGGGLVFKYDGRYYLRGIVSTGDRYSNNSIATFTDLTLYTTWIQRQISKL